MLTPEPSSCQVPVADAIRAVKGRYGLRFMQGLRSNLGQEMGKIPSGFSGRDALLLRRAFAGPDSAPLSLPARAE